MSVNIHVAQKHLDNKAKPSGSLGCLEDWAVRLCVIQNTLQPKVDYGRLLLFAGDHGVLKEDGSANSSTVTADTFAALVSGMAASSVIAASQGIELECIDVGIACDVSQLYKNNAVNAKVRLGTEDMVEKPAMTENELQAALKAGEDAVIRAQEAAGKAGRKKEHVAIILSEVGVGSTTAASAVFAALEDIEPIDVCSMCNSLHQEGIARKARIVSLAIDRHAETFAAAEKAGATGRGKAWEVLRCVGGLDLAAMAGAVLAAAERRVPVLVDGFVATIASLAAIRIAEHRRGAQGGAGGNGAGSADPSATASALGAGDVIFVAAGTGEKYASSASDALHAAMRAAGPESACGSDAKEWAGRAVLDMGMRVGEGASGCLCYGILRAAAAVAADMATLDEALAVAP